MTQQDMLIRVVEKKRFICIYIEPWHADIYDFLDLKKNHGKEEMRAGTILCNVDPRSIYEKSENNEEWTLMCPNECPGLYDCHGDEFDKLYVKYEKKSKGRKSIKARELWEKILNLRLRLVHLTCFTKILQTENLIKKSWYNQIFKFMYRDIGVHIKR